MQQILEAVLHKEFNGVTVHCEEGLKEGLRTAGRIDAIDLVLIDLRLPGYAGIEALQEFRRRFPDIPAAVVSAHDEREIIVDALKTGGAAGYIIKTSRQRSMIAALHVIAAGDVYMPPQCVSYLEARAPGERVTDDSVSQKLTERQREVLRLMLDGLSNPQIAEELEISAGTVKQHTNSIYRGLGVASRNELLRLAARGGIRYDGSPIPKVL